MAKVRFGLSALHSIGREDLDAKAHVMCIPNIHNDHWSKRIWSVNMRRAPRNKGSRAPPEGSNLDIYFVDP